MGTIGCPIRASALYKMEKGEPRRRITVDELLAFAEVFDVPLTSLTDAPVDEPSRNLEEASRAINTAWAEYEVARVAYTSASVALSSAEQEQSEAEEILHRACFDFRAAKVAAGNTAGDVGPAFSWDLLAYMDSLWPKADFDIEIKTGHGASDGVKGVRRRPGAVAAGNDKSAVAISKPTATRRGKKP